MTPPDDGAGRGAVSRLPAARPAGPAVTSAPTPIDSRRMDRMIDAVQALGAQLGETQRTLQTVVEQLSVMAEVRGTAPAAPTPVPAAVRPSVGVPVRRPAPPAPPDPTAKDRPPASLDGHVRGPDGGAAFRDS